MRGISGLPENLSGKQEALYSKQLDSHRTDSLFDSLNVNFLLQHFSPWTLSCRILGTFSFSYTCTSIWCILGLDLEAIRVTSNCAC
jgi:hypothetical protein